MSKLKLGMSAALLLALILLGIDSAGAALAAGDNHDSMIKSNAVRSAQAAMGTQMAMGAQVAMGAQAATGAQGADQPSAPAAGESGAAWTASAGASEPMPGMIHGGGGGGGEPLGYALLKVVSLLAAVAVLIYYTLRIRWMAAGSPMHLMIACMTLGMAAGLTAGTLLALITGSFSLSAMAAGAVCGAAGYLAGSRHGSIPSAEGGLAGLMGGLMGAMLGYMSLEDHPHGVLLFSVAVLAAGAALLSRLLRECSGLAAGSDNQEDVQDEEDTQLIQKFVGD